MSEQESPRCELVHAFDGQHERVEWWRDGKRYFARVERIPQNTEPVDQHFSVRLRRSEVALLAQYASGALDDVQPAMDLLWALMRTVVIGALLMASASSHGHTTVSDGGEEARCHA